MENMCPHIKSIFDKTPECGWDCHGNAYLWNALRGFWEFEECSAYMTGADFVTSFKARYCELVGREFNEEEECAEFCFGSGFGPSITPKYWARRLLPLLVDRAERLIGDCSDGLFDIRILLEDIVSRREDIIVNPTNDQLKPGGGVCGAIHSAAGGELAVACARALTEKNKSRFAEGESALTDAFHLKCKKICHVVPPNAQRGATDIACGNLRTCYLGAMMYVREKYPYRSIAFPSIATGKLGFPIDEAAVIAAEVICRECAVNPRLTVVFCCASKEDVEAYRKAFRMCADSWRTKLS